MICYIDEKMYGPPPEGVSDEQLLKEIQELELELYGKILTLDLDEEIDMKPDKKVIYSIEKKGFVDYEEFIKTEAGKHFLKECEE